MAICHSKDDMIRSGDFGLSNTEGVNETRGSADGLDKKIAAGNNAYCGRSLMQPMGSLSLIVERNPSDIGLGSMIDPESEE